jgi:glycosyltransferase involved in cell wall biosynthesis
VASLELIVPGHLDTPTGGYIYDREILAGLERLGWETRVHSLDASFPQPTAAALRQARTVFASLTGGSLAVVDGLALPGLDRILADEARRLKIVALVHHPVGLETGLDAALAARFADAERRALARARRVITTSQWTARLLATYDVPVAALRVVEPGVDARTTDASTDPRASVGDRHDSSADVRLLCVGTLTPRKGHALLFEALNELRDRRWHLRCAGSLLRDPPHVAALEHQIDRLRLKNRISLLGDLDADALEREYSRADIFVLASYLEGYGMALAEAVAHGLAIVSTTGGAIPETVPASASLLVPPGDSRALTKALASLLDDPTKRLALAANARAARSSLPTWAGAAAKFAAALDGLS